MSNSENRKPTEQAQVYFSSAACKALPGTLKQDGLTKQELADVLHKIAAGLDQMGTGLRATYILLAEVRETLNRFDKREAGEVRFVKQFTEMTQAFNNLSTVMGHLNKQPPRVS
jgi:hypothetical protein